MIHKFSAVEAGQSGQSPSGRFDSHTLAPGLQPEVPGSLRDVPDTSEAFRQWHHSVDPVTNQVGQSPEVTPRQCHLPTIEEIVTAILDTKLGGSGSTCCINSVLLAQTWSCAMSLTFNTAIWETWEKQFLSMF